MLKHSQSVQIDRMKRGDALLRIGSIWYGEDSETTVTSIYYMGNKQVATLLPIRAESAISFSMSSPPIDTLQIEIVVSYSRFATHIQRLCAQMQVSPVLPVMNPVIAAITQPVYTNKQAYAAYGFKNLNVDDIQHGIDSSTRHKLIEMYASVPVQMRIDNLAIESIRGTPRDIRLVIRLTRVLTANIYGDRVKYVRDMEGAVAQFNYINKIASESGDNSQTDAIASMFGVDVSGMQNMIKMMRNPEGFRESVGTVLQGEVIEIVAPDMYRVSVRSGDKNIIVMPYGVECFHNMRKLMLFGLHEFKQEAGLSGREGQQANSIMSMMKTSLGISNVAVVARDVSSIITGTENDNVARRQVQLTVVERGSISKLDSLTERETASEFMIHYCIITSNVLQDVGNTLISDGHGFHSPMYKKAKVPVVYEAARNLAIKSSRTLITSQMQQLHAFTARVPIREETEQEEGEEVESDESAAIKPITSATLVHMGHSKKPWKLRQELRRRST